MGSGLISPLAFQPRHRTRQCQARGLPFGLISIRGPRKPKKNNVDSKSKDKIQISLAANGSTKTSEAKMRQTGPQ